MKTLKDDLSPVLTLPPSNPRPSSLSLPLFHPFHSHILPDLRHSKIHLFVVSANVTV